MPRMCQAEDAQLHNRCVPDSCCLDRIAKEGRDRWVDQVERDDDEFPCVWQILFGRERPPENGRDTKDVEEVRGDVHSVDWIGAVVSTQVQADTAKIIGCEGLK